MSKRTFYFEEENMLKKIGRKNSVIEEAVSNCLKFILFLMFYKLFGFEVVIILALADIATSLSRMEYRSRR